MKSFLSLFLLILGLSLHAQFWLPTPDKALLVEGRIMLVEEEDFVCNKNIIEDLKQHWKLNGEIKRMSSEEIDRLLTPQNARKYVVLTGGEKQEIRSSQGKYQYQGVWAVILYAGENAGRRKNLEVAREWIFKLDFPSCLLSNEEVKFLSQHMQKYIFDEWDKANSDNRKKSKIPASVTSSMKEKTLLIPSDHISISKEEIKSLYKYPFELVDRNTIRNAIKNAEKDKMYLTVLWSDQRFEWSTAAIDCENGRVMSMVRNPDFKANIMKKKYDAETAFLSIFRSKQKINMTTIKYFGKEIYKADRGY